MPDRSTRKSKPKNLKEWLSQLGTTSDEEYARNFLLGEKLTDEGKISEETISSVRRSLPMEEPKLGFFQRISVSLRTSNIFTKKRKIPFENPPVALEDAEVEKRLIGDDVPEVPVAEPTFKYKPRRRLRSRVVSQPEPGLQTDSDPRASQRISMETEESSIGDLRTLAMEGYTPAVPGDLKGDQSVVTRLQKWFERLSMLQKMAFVLGSAVVVGLYILLIVFVISRSSHPVVSPSDVYLSSSEPIPTSVILPDGQAFELGLGTVTNGTWTPKGAEWLVGTEVPRWLSLPWNKRLESAVRAFKVNAPIQLHMSNADNLVYRFQSLQELSREEMSTFHANTTDLLIVLSKPGASTRLVILAVP